MTVKSFEEHNPLASELNQTIARENPNVLAMLSGFGKRIYFPKGILAQAAEAKQKAKRFDATIGIAREGGKPMFLPSVMKQLPGLTPSEALPYAPATGRPELRKAWREGLLAKNPSLAGRSFSLPIVTAGVTHSLSLVADLFIDRGDTLLLPDKYWENYDLLFGVRFGARIETFPLFTTAGGLDIEGLGKALAGRRGQAKTIVAFNFPNNPTGYSIRKDEADAVAWVLLSAAEAGQNLLVLNDDAYFGLFYEEDVLGESLFSHLAGVHERILAVKADGPTKEEYVWGLRTGMLTFSAKARTSDEELYRALEKKVAGAVRSAISNCSNLAQSVVAKAMVEPTFADECRQKQTTLKARARKVKEVLAGADFKDVFEAYPFNAGYFMCLRLARLDAEAYRTHLLDKHGIGVIADGAHDIRVAFSGVEEADIPALFETLAQAAREMSAG
jgi:aspartate/methionine/tyrosine aminotransferase